MAGKKDSTGGTTRKGEAERAIAGVGGIRSVCWAVLSSGGLKSLWSLNERHHIQKLV